MQIIDFKTLNSILKDKKKSYAQKEKVRMDTIEESDNIKNFIKNPPTDYSKRI